MWAGRGAGRRGPEPGAEPGELAEQGDGDRARGLGGMGRAGAKEHA